MASKTMEVAGTGTAGVDERRRPAAARHFGRIDAERGPTPINMRVEIDQPRHDEEPARIHNLGAAVGQIVPELDYLSFAKRDVDDFVAAARRINDPAAFESVICAPQPKPGGATKLRNASSSRPANAMQLWSPYCGPTICTPTGSP